MKELVPLLQTLSWVALILIGARKFSSQLEQLIEAFRIRIISGSSFKAGPVELGEDLKALERVSPSTTIEAPTENNWEKERNKIYQENKGIFLTHVIEPSKQKGQKYDIFIYLVRHKSETLSDIEYAEFFLGSYWENKVFKEIIKNEMIGITTCAYGPMLCTCRVKLKNGEIIRLERYIDFEMGRAFENNG